MLNKFSVNIGALCLFEYNGKFGHNMGSHTVEEIGLLYNVHVQ